VKLVFDDLALADLEGIYDWIAKDNPTAAKAVVEQLFESIGHLTSFPRMGYVGRGQGTFKNGLCRNWPMKAAPSP
jgi:toxin ParE1/3/4